MPESFSVASLLVPGLVILFVLALVLIIRVMVSRYPEDSAEQGGDHLRPRHERHRRRTIAGLQSGLRRRRAGLAGVSGHRLHGYGRVQHADPRDRHPQPRQCEDHGGRLRGLQDFHGAGGPAIRRHVVSRSKSAGQVQETIKSLLIGHLRSIIGKLNIDEILRDRDAFNKMVVGETAPELKKMGIQVVSLVIQDVADQHGYIDALGKRAVAEAVRDAEIKVAQAKSQSAQQVSTAEREAAIVQAANAVAVAEAEKDRGRQTGHLQGGGRYREGQGRPGPGHRHGRPAADPARRRGRARRRPGRSPDQGPAEGGRAQAAGVGRHRDQAGRGPARRPR